MAESTSSSSSKTSLRRAQTRLGVRPAGSRDPIGTSSSRGQRPTDAQQLYSSSLKQEPKVAVSPPTLSRRPSLSSIYTGSASSVSEEEIAADQPSMLPAVHPNSSAQNSPSHPRPLFINSTTKSSPCLPSDYSPRASDDYKKDFDYKRLSCEASNVTSDVTHPEPGLASLPPASSPSGHILPLNIVRRSTTQRHNSSTDSSAQNSQSYPRRPFINPSTTSSPYLPSDHLPRASHDYRKGFDYTRLSCEASNVTSDVPHPGPGLASLPPASSPSGHILPSNIIRRSTTHRHKSSADSIGRRNGSDQISADVHAMYPSQARFLPKNPRPSQPPSNASRQPSIRRFSNNDNVATAAPGNQDRQTPKQLPFDMQNYLDILSSPTVTTVDEVPSPTSMMDAPNGRSLASADTLFGVPAPSQPMAPTQTIVPEIHSTSDFDTQYQDLTGAFQTQVNLTRRQTVAFFPIAEHQGQSPSTRTEDWILQQHQPRPLRPLRAVPDNMNVQVQSSRNAESNEDFENGRSRKRKSFARKLSLFGVRTKEVS